MAKFILLWCNSLFLENNVILTNHIALNWVKGVSRFVLDWENKIRGKFSLESCSKIPTLTIYRTVYAKIELMSCVES